MIEIKNRKIGLVLSGGGAKGAYQVGMFRALEELRLDRQITAMSGCSIGAYAGAIYSIRGADAYRDFLCGFMALASEGVCLSEEEVAHSRQEVAARRVSAGQFISQRRFWQYEALGLHRYIETLLSEGSLEQSGRILSVCGYSIEAEKPVYFRLNGMPDREKAAAIIGSGSLPYLFRPSPAAGHHCLDGGVIPDICENPAPCDKVPLKPLLTEDVDLIIINYLTTWDAVDTHLIPSGIGFLELRPSAALESAPGAGTLDFSAEKLKSHEEMGYLDTLRLLKANCIL